MSGENVRTGPTWQQQTLMFVYFTLVNIPLLGVGIVLVMLVGLGRLPSICLAWMWVFAFPHAVACELQSDMARPLLWLNPSIYGGLWWLAWRMFTLMRRKREE